MRTYTYAALAADNSYTKGQVKADGEKRALKKLKKEGLLVINIKKEASGDWRSLLAYSTVSRLDKIYLTRHIYTFLDAGIAIDQAVRISAEQVENKKLKEILWDAYEHVRSGQTLSSALERHKKYFSLYFLQLLKIGEKSGRLDNILKHLLKQQEQEYELVTKVKSAMIYPIILLLAAVGVVIFMLSFVVPTVSQVLNDWGGELPISTKILIASSDFILKYGLLMLPIVFFFIFLMVLAVKKTIWAAWYFEAFMLNFPLIKKINKEYNIARMLISISTPITSGISIDESLNLAASTSKNHHYRRSIEKGRLFVRKGIPLSEVLLGYPDLYPPNVTRMIEMGEKTGKTDSMFQRISEFYQKSVYNTFDNLSKAMEPLLLLFIGFIVGFIAVSVLTPMWKFAETI